MHFETIGLCRLTARMSHLLRRCIQHIRHSLANAKAVLPRLSIVGFDGAVAAHRSLLKLSVRDADCRAVMLFVKVAVRPRTDQQLRQFEASLQQVPDVIAAYRLSGSSDYLIQIKQRSFLDFANFEVRVIENLPGYVKSTTAVVAATIVGPDAFSAAAC